MAQDIPLLLVTHLDVSRLLQDIISVYAICSSSPPNLQKITCANMCVHKNVCMHTCVKID